MTTTPELLALHDVCRRLDGAGIPYMLTGSLAMSFQRNNVKLLEAGDE